MGQSGNSRAKVSGPGPAVVERNPVEVFSTFAKRSTKVVNLRLCEVVTRRSAACRNCVPRAAHMQIKAGFRLYSGWISFGSKFSLKLAIDVSARKSRPAQI
jgi:hypothetical protein